MSNLSRAQAAWDSLLPPEDPYENFSTEEAEQQLFILKNLDRDEMTHNQIFRAEFGIESLTNFLESSNGND